MKLRRLAIVGAAFALIGCDLPDIQNIRVERTYPGKVLGLEEHPVLVTVSPDNEPQVPGPVRALSVQDMDTDGNAEDQIVRSLQGQSVSVLSNKAFGIVTFTANKLTVNDVYDDLKDLSFEIELNVSSHVTASAPEGTTLPDHVTISNFKVSFWLQHPMTGGLHGIPGVTMGDFTLQWGQGRYTMSPPTGVPPRFVVNQAQVNEIVIGEGTFIGYAMVEFTTNLSKGTELTFTLIEQGVTASGTLK